MFEKSYADKEYDRETGRSIGRLNLDLESIGVQGRKRYKTKDNFGKSVVDCMNWEE